MFFNKVILIHFDVNQTNTASDLKVSNGFVFPSDSVFPPLPLLRTCLQLHMVSRALWMAHRAKRCGSCVYSSFIHNCQNLEVNKMALTRFRVSTRQWISIQHSKEMSDQATKRLGNLRCMLSRGRTHLKDYMWWDSRYETFGEKKNYRVSPQMYTHTLNSYKGSAY